MLSRGLIEFLLYLLVPVVLLNFFRSRGKKDSSTARRKRLTGGDYVFYGGLGLAAAGYFASATAGQPPNVFKRLGASPLASCDALREKLELYSERHPACLPAGGIAAAYEKASSDFAALEYYRGSECGRMDFLIDRFCAFPADRDVYLKFGEHAFLGSISSDFGPRGQTSRTQKPARGQQAETIAASLPDIGFVLYTVTAQAFTYLPAFVLFGLLTTPLATTGFAPSRVYLRPWGVTMLCSLLAVDMYWLLIVPTETDQRQTRLATLWLISPDSSDPALFYADASEHTRKILIAACLAALTFMDYLTSSRQTDLQLLMACLDEQADLLASAKNHTVLETAVLLTGRLRDRLVTQWKQEEVVRRELFAEPDFKQKYEQAATDSKSRQWVEANAPAALRSFDIPGY
ncbi:hypothetical protein H4R18_002396 [Coemansia javaensis]|uniref:Uncharacterized protein n=1 Tax=Coemansia javaensis TaxID=2761396 RepID=A0A9W8LK40_9FUNG|nr:hypothetical protein H4R18_002396 [Coemansia javaensis]